MQSTKKLLLAILFALLAAGPTSANCLETSNVVTIGRGTLTVSVSNATPQGITAQIVKSTNAQTLGVFDARAIGEDILVSSLGFKIIGSTSASDNGTPLTSVGLYNEAGNLVSSNFVDFTDAELKSGTAKYFNLSVVIPANTTKKFYIKGVTEGIMFPDPAFLTVRLANNLAGGNAIIGTGVDSSIREGSHNVNLVSTLALPVISVNQGPDGIVSGDALIAPRNQAILSPSAQVLVGTMKYAALREDQIGKEFILVGFPSIGTLDGLISSVALYDGTTQITNFVAPSGDTILFSGADVFSPAVTFVKGTAKTLSIIANVAGNIDGKSFYFGGEVTTVGKTSGQPFSTPTVDLRTYVGSEMEAGEYVIRTKVLEIHRLPSSPLNFVGRGMYKTYAIFGIDSHGVKGATEIKNICFRNAFDLASNTTPNMYRLVDTGNGTIFPVTVNIDVEKAKICFSGINWLNIEPGVTKTLLLRQTFLCGR
jgi:hypothetical protein